jgi:hypothetical protein
MIDDEVQNELTPEQNKLLKRIAGLKQTNKRMVETIEHAGARVNLSEARVERLASFLVDAGVITIDQALAEQEAWELGLREQVQPVYDQVKRAMEMAGVPQQTESGLVIPGVNAPRNPRG